ncbi:MAG: cation transporter [Candidatus Rokubacteria bacterium]|nr:cation transporter [Candidatus Rokubacteria bacterium]
MAHAPHGTAAARSRGALRLAFALTVVFLVVEAAAAWFTGSLALLADAGHMLADAAGLALALFAIWIAARPPTPEKTYGYYRVEILAALVNAVVLLGVSVGILVEAWQRIVSPRPVDAGPMLGVAALGLLVNLVCAWLLHHGAEESLNVRAAYLDVLSDAATSAGVIVAAGIVLLTGWTTADPLTSAVIAIMIVWRTWHLLMQAVNVLLEGTPAHLDLGQIETAMREVPGVRRVHDLHVWTLTSGREAMSAHVVVDDVRESDRLLEELHTVLHARFGIDHTTMQLETDPNTILRIKAR